MFLAKRLLGCEKDNALVLTTCLAPTFQILEIEYLRYLLDIMQKFITAL